MGDSNNNLNSDSDPGLVLLHPDPNKCLGRVPSLSKVDGLESSEVELLNNWFSSQWKVVYSSGFVMNEAVTRGFTEYLQANSFIAVDLDKVDSYLSVQKLLYNGLRLELVDSSENVSQCKLFHRYYYSCRENPTSLNNPVVLSNVIWSLKKYRRDEFALTCLVDVLLQSYMVALDSFISLGGVTVIKETFEFLARNSRLKQSTKFLLKCMDLLDKLDINLEILKSSKIGIHVNCIALAKCNPVWRFDYECGDDKVKLKATNLIKKWKAIRDASMPTKTKADDPRFKKQSSGTGPDKRVERQHTLESPPTHESEGSFVLNIINTMAEEKEKEKKRKLDIRNAQLAAKYKSKSSEEKGEEDDSTTYANTSGSVTSSSTSASSTNAVANTTSGTSRTVMERDSQHMVPHGDRVLPGTSAYTTTATSKGTKSTSGSGGSSSNSSDRIKIQRTGTDYEAKGRDLVKEHDHRRTDHEMDNRNKHNEEHMESKVETKSSDNQLASLMNFFKEYSSKTDDKKPTVQESPVNLSNQQVQTQSNTQTQKPTKLSTTPVSFQPHLPTMVGKPKPPAGPPPVSSLVNAVPPSLPNLQMGAGVVPGLGAGPVPGPVPSVLEQPMDTRSYPSTDFRSPFPEVPPPMFGAFPILGQALPPGFIPPPPPPPPAPPAPPGHPPFPGVQMDGMVQPNTVGVVPPVSYNFEFQNPAGQLYQDNKFGFYPMGQKQMESEETEDNAPPPWK